MLEYPQPSNVRGKIVFVPKNKRTKCGNANCFFEVHSFHSLKRLGLSWNHYLVFQRQHLAIQLPSRFRVPVRNGNSMCNHGAISSDHHGTMERWYTSIAQSRWKSFSLSRYPFGHVSCIHDVSFRPSRDHRNFLPKLFRADQSFKF